ncbi:MAG: fibronectin type III domain-containing protein, partial [Polyangiaceae bacterium]
MGTYKLANRSSLTLVLLTGAGLTAGFLPSCGGEDITCGSGTHKDGSQCVPNSEGAGGTGSNVENAPPTFDGIRSVAPAGDTSLQVTWNAATDDVTAADSLVYNVYVATSSGTQNYGAPTVTSPPGAQSVLVGGLTKGTEYFIVVRAQDEAGAMDENTTEQSGAPDTDDTPPTFAGITGTEPAGATAVKVSWDAATDDKTPAEGITYTVRWATAPGASPTGKVGAVSVPGASSVVVTGLPAAESTFYFNVRASDAAGNAETNDVEKDGGTGKDTTAPVFGGCTSVGAPGATKATLSWDPAKDDVETADTMTYNVYAFTEPPDAETPFGAPQGTFVGGIQGEVTGLANATTYYFVCRAADSAGNEDANLSFRTTTTLTDGNPPTFGGITGVVEGSTSAELTWDAASDDQTAESGIVYLVYQGTIAGTALDNPPVAQSSPGSLGITLTGLSSSTAYYWVVRAQDEAGNESDNTTEETRTTKVSFAQDIESAIFDKQCNKEACHGLVNPQQGMTLAPGFAYFNLVDVVAVE